MGGVMSEKSLHKAVCHYIRLQYPKVIFNSDLSGLKLTIGQAVKVKELRSSRAFPDIMIFEPRGKYHGLFIELKAENEKLFKKDCKTFITPHVQEQAEMIDLLMIRNYAATFAIGFNQAKMILDAYLNYGELQKEIPYIHPIFDNIINKFKI